MVGNAMHASLDNHHTPQYNTGHVALKKHVSIDTRKETEPGATPHESAHIDPCVGGTPAHCANHT
jgi:hypothetical protein